MAARYLPPLHVPFVPFDELALLEGGSGHVLEGIEEPLHLGKDAGFVAEIFCRGGRKLLSMP